VNLIPTELNQRLASAVRYSVSADRFYITGKAAFWRLVGLGIVALAIGVGTGSGFFGYSYITRNTDGANVFASAFSKALAEVQLRAIAEGTVQLQPNELSLVKGQVISIDPSSRVLLDPAAKVRADGEIQIQGPTISPLEGMMSRRATIPTPTITNFTVFKRVELDVGEVWTGWKFLTSAQKTPTHQYCYYTEKLEASQFEPVVYFAVDERLDPPKQLPKGFDIDAAFKKCVWFKRENS
jgi:hypothetical protein